MSNIRKIKLKGKQQLKFSKKKSIKLIHYCVAESITPMLYLGKLGGEKSLALSSSSILKF